MRQDYNKKKLISMSTLESHYLQLQQFLSQPTADTRLLSRLLNSHPDASRQTHLLYQKLYLYLFLSLNLITINNQHLWLPTIFCKVSGFRIFHFCTGQTELKENGWCPGRVQRHNARDERTDCCRDEEVF